MIELNDGMAYVYDKGMTIKQTLDTIRAMGLSARYNSEYKEYRITVKGLKPAMSEACAYYTNDSNDAIGTAQCMLKEHGIKNDN